ncbi:MAG: glycosyltransferase 87 family protein [Myxococcaceae bacterium]
MSAALRRHASRHTCIAVAFVLASALIHIIVASPPGAHARWSLALGLVLTALMLGAWALGQSASARSHRWTLWAGVAARLVVAPVDVSANHDVQRYLWDGAVVGAGFDPYRLPPASPELAELRRTWPTPNEHETYPTLYPPGALLLFRAATLLGRGSAPAVWKIFVLLASVAMLFVTAAALRALSLERHLALVALSPLLLLETAIGAHVDIFAALGVASALYLLASQRMWMVGIALGAGALVKFLPVFALLPIAVHFQKHRGARAVAAAGAVGALGYGLAMSVGLRPLGSLGVFFAKWRFGSPVFAALESAFGDVNALRLAPLLALGVLVFVAWRAQRDWKAPAFLALAATLWFSPVVFPWYLVPMLPLMAAAPSGFALGWVTSLPLTLEVYDRWETTGVWQPGAWPLWAIAMSWVLGAAFDFRLIGSSRAVQPR